MVSTDLQRLQSVSHLMARLSLVAITLIPIGYLAIWFNVFGAHEVLGVHGSDTFIQSAQTGTFKRLVGFALSIVPQLALIYGLLQLRQLFTSVSHESVFGEGAAENMRGFARALLAFAVLDFVMVIPLSAWVTFDNPPGQRSIQVNLGEGDLQTWFLIALFYALTRVIAEGIRLQREVSEFV